jgi:hypothetical protein
MHVLKILSNETKGKMIKQKAIKIRIPRHLESDKGQRETKIK